MAKRTLALILSVLFLAQSAAFSQDFLPRTIPDNSIAKVSLNKPEISFFKKYDIYILCMSLLIYKLDAVERYSKESIKKEINLRYDNAFFNLSGIDFNLDELDCFKKKGFTRYYPFRVNDTPYIVRIFRSDEKAFQPEVEVLYEASVKNPAVTFQILSGVNAILDECSLKPQKILYPSKAELCP